MCGESSDDLFVLAQLTRRDMMLALMWLCQFTGVNEDFLFEVIVMPDA